MAVGDLVQYDINGITVTGVQLTNAHNSSIARIFDDGDVAAFRPRGERPTTLAAAGTPAARAAARLITDSNAPYAGSVNAAARANGLPPTTENSLESWNAARDQVRATITGTGAARAAAPRPASSPAGGGTGNS